MWQDVLKDHRLQLAATGVVSAVTAALTTYVVTSKRLEAKYSELAQSEIAEVKRFYALQASKNETSLDEMAAKYQEAAAPYLTGQRPLVVVPDPEPQEPEEPDKDEDDGVKWPLESDEATTSIFDSLEPDTYFVLEEEIRKREADPRKPFVLSKAEFDEEEDRSQITLTYWESDNVLVDESDDMVEDADGLVGTVNLSRFGHGSGDKNVVYVRNPRLSVDFEILRSNGDYKQDVLGLPSTLEHSDKPGLRRFRLYD